MFQRVDVSSQRCVADFAASLMRVLFYSLYPVLKSIMYQPGITEFTLRDYAQGYSYEILVKTFQKRVNNFGYILR